MEIWKPYPGNTKYAVSTEGRVRNDVTGRILKPGRTKSGYRAVSLPGYISRYVHRMVWETHVGPIPEGWEVRHGPNGREDNRLNQLDVGTPEQNARDRITHGTQARGQDHGRSAVNRQKFANARIPC